VSTRLREKTEKIQETLNTASDESATGTLVVVEGKKDVEALRRVGVGGPILTAKTGGKSFAEVLLQIEQVNANEVILMLDFDRRGREATARFTASLERTKVKPNCSFWRELSTLLSREVQCIEGLTSYIQTLEQKTA